MRLCLFLIQKRDIGNGPGLVDIMGKFTVSTGVPALPGPFFISGRVLFIVLRPDPLEIAKMIEAVTAVDTFICTFKRLQHL